MRKIIVKRETVDGRGHTCCVRDETVSIDVRGYPTGTVELTVELASFNRENRRQLPGKTVCATLTPEQAQQLAEWLTTPEPMLRYDRSKAYEEA